MTNRVLLNDSGLKISKPGIDVLSASHNDLQFDSTKSQIGYKQSGTFTTDLSTSFDRLVTFSPAFDEIPIVCFYHVMSGERWLLGYSPIYFRRKASNGDRYRETMIVTRTNGIYCRSIAAGTTGTAPASVTIAYEVLEYRM